MSKSELKRRAIQSGGYNEAAENAAVYARRIMQLEGALRVIAEHAEDDCISRKSLAETARKALDHFKP